MEVLIDRKSAGMSFELRASSFVGVREKEKNRKSVEIQKTRWMQLKGCLRAQDVQGENIGSSGSLRLTSRRVT